MITPLSVACATKLIKANLKDVSTDNVHTSQSNTLDTIMHHYYQQYIFHVEYILSQKPLFYSMDLWECQAFWNFCNLFLNLYVCYVNVPEILAKILKCAIIFQFIHAP